MRWPLFHDISRKCWRLTWQFVVEPMGDLGCNHLRQEPQLAHVNATRSVESTSEVVSLKYYLNGHQLPKPADGTTYHSELMMWLQTYTEDPWQPHTQKCSWLTVLDSCRCWQEKVENSDSALIADENRGCWVKSLGLVSSCQRPGSFTWSLETELWRVSRPR